MKYAILIVFSILSLSTFGATSETQAAANVTASSQTSNEMDLYLISRIRQDLMAEKDLSTYAKNIKIIALDGQVILKGPVRSREEAFKILKFARATAGVPNVINEMTVTPENNK